MSPTHRLALIALLLTALLVGRPAKPTAYALFAGSWAASPVDYYVNATNAWVTAAAALAAVQLGAAQWSEQSQADIALNYAGATTGRAFVNNGKNEVFFRSDITNGGFAAESRVWWNGALEMLDADIVFYDAAYRWYAASGCTGSALYYENVATHEFGHFLGITHSGVAAATMYPSMDAWCSRNWITLDADDILAIEDHYPPGGMPPDPNTPPAVVVTAPTNNATFLPTATITFTATATDTQDGTITDDLVWTSNLQGQIGTGGTFGRTLSTGVHTITASVTDEGGLSASGTRTISVSALTGPVLSARPYKVKGKQKVDLTWANVTGTVDIYRNNVRIVASGTNDGFHTDPIDAKGGGVTYTYRVCTAGTQTCTANATASF